MSIWTITIAGVIKNSPPMANPPMVSVLTRIKIAVAVIPAVIGNQ
jgi:hypothetical protein